MSLERYWMCTTRVKQRNQAVYTQFFFAMHLPTENRIRFYDEPFHHVLYCGRQCSDLIVQHKYTHVQMILSAILETDPIDRHM